MEFLFAALILGAAGSLHCVGMCGPIALALPVHHFPFARRIFSILIYHTGRIFTYAVLGAIFSLLGAGIAIAGYQQALSILLGSLLFLSALISIGAAGNKISAGLSNFLKKQFGRLLGRRSLPAFFFTGILNGLLPCGMLYVALAGATVSDTPIQGVLFMVVFGLGTLPAMMSVSLISSISSRWRKALRRASPVLTMVMGVLLVIRGLGLGIPVLSPEIDRNQQIKQCNHPTHSTDHEQQTD